MNYQKARRLTIKTDWAFNAQKNRIGIESKVNNLKEEPKENGTIFEILESKLKLLDLEANTLFNLEKFEINKVIMEECQKLKWEINSNWKRIKILPENQVPSVRNQIILNNKKSEENKIKTKALKNELIK